MTSGTIYGIATGVRSQGNAYLNSPAKHVYKGFPFQVFRNLSGQTSPLMSLSFCTILILLNFDLPGFVVAGFGGR